MSDVILLVHPQDIMRDIINGITRRLDVDVIFTNTCGCRNLANKLVKEGRVLVLYGCDIDSPCHVCAGDIFDRKELDDDGISIAVLTSHRPEDCKKTSPNIHFYEARMKSILKRITDWAYSGKNDV